MKRHRSHKINRRQFLHRAGAGVALFNILPGSLLNGAERLSPNAKLNVAGIGIGSRGGADVGEVAELGHNFVALCDVDENFLAAAKQRFPAAKTYNDFRRLLHQRDIDAVVVATPDHTHAVATAVRRRYGLEAAQVALGHSKADVTQVYAERDQGLAERIAREIG